MVCSCSSLILNFLTTIFLRLINLALGKRNRGLKLSNDINFKWYSNLKIVRILPMTYNVKVTAKETISVHLLVRSFATNTHTQRPTHTHTHTDPQRPTHTNLVTFLFVLCL